MKFMGNYTWKLLRAIDNVGLKIFLFCVLILSKRAAYTVIELHC